MANPDTAPVSERLRAGLRLVYLLTLCPDDITGTDLEKARAAGLDDAAIRDAAMVCTMFSIITRLADTLEFALPESFAGSAKALTSKMGYRMPAPALLLPRV
jgi:alkylhydroperoxidase family enzyme